jgi:hypothetical protein
LRCGGPPARAESRVAERADEVFFGLGASSSSSSSATLRLEVDFFNGF